MLPLEVASLPMSTNTISLYIDGKIEELENALFVMNQVLYVPIYEICRYLGFYKIDLNRKTIEYTDKQRYRVRENCIIEDNYMGQTEWLEYGVKTIDEVTFVDAVFLVREIGITITWEKDTGSVYFATMPHYDGYAFLPKHFFDDVDIIIKSANKFFYAEGIYSGTNEQKFFVAGDSSGSIFFDNLNCDLIEKGTSCSICFRLYGFDESRHMPCGHVLEVHDSRIGYRHRLGNMSYTDTDWVQICRKIPSFGNTLNDDGTLGKETLKTMLENYPFVLRNRSSLSYWLKLFFPNCERERNLLLTAFDNDIFSDIEDEEEVLDDIFVNEMVQRMVNAYGIRLKYAIETVCLCCEVYGGLVKGKEYVNKKKYNEDTQLLIEAKEQKWVDPELQGRAKIGEASYLIPVGWSNKESRGNTEGIYYYPYDTELAQIYIRVEKCDGIILYEEFDFEEYFAGMASGDSSNILSITEYITGMIKGKKANILMPIEDSIYELDVFAFPVNGHLYSIAFGEETVLTHKMQEFEDEFLFYFSFGVETNTEEEIPDEYDDELPFN